MNFGLSSLEYQLLHDLALEPLRKAGARIWIFGSRARGDQKPFSDIDILIELGSDSHLPPGLLSQIKEAVEESRLPYKVDFVNITDLAESYRQGVLQDRIPL